MKTHLKKHSKPGFALIVTLSLMILLTIIAVGLLTLSSISLRATSQSASQALANSNARLALMLAIGDLQKHLGPDQRISATASVFNASAQQPNAVGAWDSFGWKGPDGGAPAPDDKSSKFRSWLVSAKDPQAATQFAFGTGAPSGDSIWLRNPATTEAIPLNDPAMRAERVPVTVGATRGGFAYMVSDNSTKASISLQARDAEDLAENIANRTAGTAPRPDVLDDSFDQIDYDGDPGSPAPDPSDLISMQTAALAVGVANKGQVLGRSPSLTTTSLGLLTDVVNGGLKTDLTPLMESATAASSVLGNTPYFSSADGAPTWEYLRSHYQLHKRVTGQASGKPRYRLSSTDLRPVNEGQGIKPDPTKEALLPVIAKMQIVFSLVSHHAHIGDRVQAFNTKAQPPGNTLHATPHLVYDPVVTLYNPYDVELQLDQLRIRVWDPPVGFQFQKHDLAARTAPWYRPEFGSGQFHGLARFQIANEKNVNARRTFTLQLKNMTPSGASAGQLILLPGEVKVFAPRVESHWTWGFETAGGYTPKSFFDWEVGNDFGNRDNRRTPPNMIGLEAIAQLDWRAGLQTDHLSYANGRSDDSKYSWERGVAPFGAGWLSLKLSDEVTVKAKPQRTVVDTNLPDFRIDLLSGLVQDPTRDILRTYEFRLGDVASEMSVNTGGSNIITRKFQNASILQTPGDPGAGGKSPFAVFTMSAKTTKDVRDDSKAWLFNNLVTEGASHNSSLVGNAAQSYDLSLKSITDFQDPSLQYDDINKRGFFGAMASPFNGVSIVPMYRTPITPAASLGDWIGSNLIASSQLPRVNYALGNSYGHPLIPSDTISTGNPMGSGRMLDHSWLMNAALWDSYFFSSATNYNSAAFGMKRAQNQVLQDFFSAEKPMLNSRLIPYISGEGEPDTVANRYGGMGEAEFANKFAKNALVAGAFNINSASVDAWRAVLSSLRGQNVTGYGNISHDLSQKTPFVRGGLPVAGAAENGNPANTANVLGQIRWAGFRTLTDPQIEALAISIVEEIRARAAEDEAPLLSVADFVNRRIGSGSALHANRGILQTAIDKLDESDNSNNINRDFHDLDSRDIIGSALPQDRVRGLANKNALDGKTADGAAPMLTQGDLLTALAPIITARGDTFTVRAYGESRNASGTTVVARAWCEATVQRVPEFTDPSDEPEADIASLSEPNEIFGRRFVITSFRWLNASEI